MKNIKKYGLFVFVIISLIFINNKFVFAEIGDGGLKGEFKNKIGELRNDQRQLTEAEKLKLKNEVGELRNEFKGKLENKEFANEEVVKQAHLEMINSIKALRSEFKTTLLEGREVVKAKIQTEREKFKEELGKLKDENKKIVSERIFDKIAELNTKITDNLSNLVDNMENVLLGIESRTSKAKDKGLDVSTVETDIAGAKVAIKDARDAILAQTKETYTTTITDETKLKEQMKALRDSFASDIKALRTIVKSAHEAVRKSAVTLAQIPKVDDDQDVESDNGENN